MVDPRGVVAGPRDRLDATAARRAFERGLKAEKLVLYDDEVKGEDVRVAVSPVFGPNEVLGAIVSFIPQSEADDSVREFALAVGVGSLALWLLACAAGYVLAGRAIAPAVVLARREEAFLADAAHELRTPVAVIRTRAEQAQRAAPEGDPSAGSFKAISEAAERATNTIADMLELARLDARRGKVDREPLRLDALAEQVADERRDEASAAAVNLDVQVEGPVVVEGDERLLGRALGNLVDNAIRHGGAGGQVNVAVRGREGAAEVEVSDSGPGVPPGQRDEIFNRFHRASGAGSKGSGLGLPIALLVAESHGGRLELAPTEPGGLGARFTLHLPLDGDRNG